MPEGWRSLFTARAGAASSTRALLAKTMRQQLEREVLPGYLASQRWFAGKGHNGATIELAQENEWAFEGRSWLLAIANVKFAEAEQQRTQRYSLPLSVAWEQEDGERFEVLKHCTVARVRQRARVGIVYDALWDDAFCRAVVGAIGRNLELAIAGGRLAFRSTQAFRRLAPAADAPIRRPSMEQSHTSVMVGEGLILKFYRRLARGINPEVEIGRFLTEASPFANVAPLAGALEYRGDDGSLVALAVLQGMVSNQGNGWGYVVDYLQRHLDAAVTAPATAAPTADDPHAGFIAVMRTLGRRTGELHSALARTTGDPAFDPEPIRDADLAFWAEELRTDAERGLAQLGARHESLTEAQRRLADRVLGARSRLTDHVNRLAQGRVAAAKTRVHGDYHLGQVLVSKNDFAIIDFEGEPSRTLDERRRKQSPLKDVAGMLRSFSYAGATALALATVARGEADDRRLEAEVARWERETAAAFLDGYAAAATGASSFVQDPARRAELIDCFKLEKAFYELRYELGNRPDWVGIPLAGLVAMLEAQPVAAEAEASPA
jgi:maltose alpha-D-glucosyltransferase/alpha-amylase